MEVLEQYHLHNDQLGKIVEGYQQLRNEYGTVDAKTFLYGSDPAMNGFVAGLLHFPYELHDWGRRMEGYSVKLDMEFSLVGQEVVQLDLELMEMVILPLRQRISPGLIYSKYLADLRGDLRVMKIKRVLMTKMR